MIIMEVPVTLQIQCKYILSGCVNTPALGELDIHSIFSVMGIREHPILQLLLRTL